MYMPYIKYDVYFNLTLEDVMRVQKENTYNLQFDYKCVYFFIEETHKELIEVEQNGMKRQIRTTFYSLVVLYSKVPLKKEHIVAVLKKIPNTNIGSR